MEYGCCYLGHCYRGYAMSRLFLSCLRLVNQVSEALLVVKHGVVVLDVAARALLLETRPINVLCFGKEKYWRVG